MTLPLYSLLSTALPSKSGGFQLPKIKAVSSQIWVESPDSMYFDWASAQYIHKVRHSEMKVGTVKIVSTSLPSKSQYFALWDPFLGLLKYIKV